MRTHRLTVLLLAAGCAPKEQPPVADTTAAVGPAAPSRVATVEGFSTPESVIFDPDQGVWFVTNVNGAPSDKDGNGFISRLTRDGAIDSLHFIQGGRGGAVLNAPKGQAITGDTLWVADIDAVRGFDKRTGAPLASVEFGKRARFLNDITVGPDGALYITDTGIRISGGKMEHPGPDRLFRLSGGQITILAEGPQLEGPNGIMWDQGRHRFVMVGFGGKSVFAWAPDSVPTKVAEGPGGQDGVVVLNDGRILVSSWADSTVFVAGEGGSTPVVTGVDGPADIGLDAARGRIAIPVFNLNRVEFWNVP
jgi:sugar lactone lactonase YvrE